MWINGKNYMLDLPNREPWECAELREFRCFFVEDWAGFKCTGYYFRQYNYSLLFEILFVTTGL